MERVLLFLDQTFFHLLIGPAQHVLEIIQISWLEVKTSIFPRDFGRLVLGDQEELAGVLRHFPYLHLPNETIFKAPHPSDIGFSDLIRSQI